MIKIFQKLIFHNKNSKLNKKTIASVIDEYKKLKNKNLHFLINERFSWMQQFINKTDDGLEVGAGAAFSKHLLNAKTLLTSDFSNDSHLDYQNIDAEKTGLEKSKYDFVIASNMMHHVPHPIIFLEEMYRILKPGGKLIIFEPHVSLIYQLVTFFTKHEGFDFTVDVWNKDKPVKQNKNPWDSNQAVAYLLFKNHELFHKNINSKFEIIYDKFAEFMIFLNSGGIYSKSFYIPLNFTFLKIVNFIDKILIKLFPNIFALGRKIVLVKNKE